MIVFLRNISAKTTYYDIVELIEPTLKGGLLRKDGRIERVQLLIIKDPKKDKLEFHGLVRIEPDNIAEKTIKKLNKHSFLGRPIQVREYVHRRWQNDLRVQKMLPNYVLICERKKDRRRNHLERIISDHNERGIFKYTFL